MKNMRVKALKWWDSLNPVEKLRLIQALKEFEIFLINN